MTEPARARRHGAASPRPRVTGRLRGVRERARSVPGGVVMWRIGITVIGVAMLVVGVLLLPLPGPGWLIIFAALGLLATEYTWASRLLSRARLLAAELNEWVACRGTWIRVIIGVFGLMVLAAALAGSWFLYKVV
jgi:uncharacterized protein (TIGR02611 family)